MTKWVGRGGVNSGTRDRHHTVYTGSAWGAGHHGTGMLQGQGYCFLTGQRCMAVQLIQEPGGLGFLHYCLVTGHCKTQSAPEKRTQIKIAIPCHREVKKDYQNSFNNAYVRNLLKES